MRDISGLPFVTFEADRTRILSSGKIVFEGREDVEVEDDWHCWRGKDGVCGFVVVLLLLLFIQTRVNVVSPSHGVIVDK